MTEEKKTPAEAFGKAKTENEAKTESAKSAMQHRAGMSPEQDLKDNLEEHKKGKDEPTPEKKAAIDRQNEIHNAEREAEPHKPAEPEDSEKHPEPADLPMKGETYDENMADPRAHEEPREARLGREEFDKKDPVQIQTEQLNLQVAAAEQARQNQINEDRSGEFEKRTDTVSYWNTQFSRLNLGKYQFEDNRLDLEAKDVKDFEKLLEDQPPQIRNSIQKIDPDAGHRFAKRVKPAMRQGVDTTASTRTGTPNPAPGRN